MLTRLEIDGFKSYEDFAIDLGPHALILGANGVGKSNLFDALRFLSSLATSPVSEAARDLRGRPEELFSFDADGVPRDDMRFAIELLLPSNLVDPFENEVSLSNTRVRYEVTLARAANGGGPGELLVTHEYMARLAASDDGWAPSGRRPSKPFRRAHIHRTGRTSPYLSTDGGEFKIHQEGNQGRTRRLPATRAHATALSTVTSADEFPHLFALRAALASWLFLALEPGAIRDPQRTSWNPRIEPDGRNLGRVLDRIRAETATPNQPLGALADIAADLREIVDGVTGLAVEPDEANRDFRIELKIGDKRVPYSSHLVSDGTLRALALCAVFNDPSFSGVLLMEQPEDGMHPARLLSLVDRIREHTSDPHARHASSDVPLQQVITNSHSPVLLGTARDQIAEAWFADMVLRIGDGRSVRRTRMRPVVPSDQGDLVRGERVSGFEVERYLKTVLGGS